MIDQTVLPFKLEQTRDLIYPYCGHGVIMSKPEQLLQNIDYTFEMLSG